MNLHEQHKLQVFSPAQKVAILKLHLLEKVNVDDICELYKIHPATLYSLQNQLFEYGEQGFNSEIMNSEVTQQSNHQSESQRLRDEQPDKVLMRLKYELGQL